MSKEMAIVNGIGKVAAAQPATPPSTATVTALRRRPRGEPDAPARSPDPNRVTAARKVAKAKQVGTGDWEAF